MDGVRTMIPLMVFEFEIPQEVVGRLIGKQGTYVNKIKQVTRAHIVVKKHHTNPDLKVCVVEGLYGEIANAIDMIRARFPAKKYPHFRLDHFQHPGTPMSPMPVMPFLPPNNKLNLIGGVVNDVSVCCVMGVGHIFVQQPTHPTYPALAKLNYALSVVYDNGDNAPKLVRPFNVGVICVARMGEQAWYRAEVVRLNEEEEEATVRLVDKGGYAVLPVEELRQIRLDFVSVPFQGIECRLAGVIPLESTTEQLDEEIKAYFQSICPSQVLQAHVAGYSPDTQETLIYLYRRKDDQAVLVNQELVDKGFAQKCSPDLF